MPAKAVIRFAEAASIAFLVGSSKLSVVAPAVSIAVVRKADVVEVVVASIVSIVFRSTLTILETFLVSLFVGEACALISTAISTIVLIVPVAPFVIVAVLVTVLAVFPQSAVLAVAVALAVCGQ